MSEIEKMYENAGIIPKKNCYYWDCPYSTGNIDEDDKKEKDCENCNNPDKKTYPPFTAEKQIELIKWLCTEDDDFISIIAIDYGRWKINYNLEEWESEEIKGLNQQIDLLCWLYKDLKEQTDEN